MAEIPCKSDPVLEVIYPCSTNIAKDKTQSVVVDYNGGNRRLIVGSAGKETTYFLEPPKKPLGTPGRLDVLLEYVEPTLREKFLVDMTNYIGSL